MSVTLFLLAFSLGALSIAVGYIIGYQHGFDSALRNLDE